MERVLKRIWGLKANILLISIGYLLLIATVEGLRVEHWAIVILFNSMVWISPQTRRLILALAAFAVFGILYDLMKVCPNFKVNSVDIASIYQFDKHWFGIQVNGILLSLNEFFAQHHHWIADLLSGLFYINWMPVPIVFGIWLYIKNKRQFLYFSLAFLFVNLLGFVIYYIHPAAPPWYVAKYGFKLNLQTGGETAGLVRFDELLGLKLFRSVYSRNSNVFAALPSLHCAYPVIVLYYSIQANIKWMRWFFVFFMLGIWFSAVYSGHHYVVDVIAGAICAIIGLLVFEKVLMKNKSFEGWIDKYVGIVSKVE